MKPLLVALSVAALALGGCGGGAGNGSAQNAANAAAPANIQTSAAQEPSSIAIDEQRLLAACVPANERGLTIGQLSRTRRGALNRCYNEEAVRQLAPRLRLRIDPMTQIVLVRAEGEDLIYDYRIARRLATLEPGLAERLEAHTRRQACLGEDVRNVIALGGAQVYRWVDADGALIREVRVDACPEQGRAP